MFNWLKEETTHQHVCRQGRACNLKDSFFAFVPKLHVYIVPTNDIGTHDTQKRTNDIAKKFEQLMKFQMT